MAVKIRLARGGSKKRPFYRIVAADGLRLLKHQQFLQLERQVENIQADGDAPDIGR